MAELSLPVDIFTYTPDEWNWIEQNTGLQPEDFTGFAKVPAWQFEGEQIWEVVDPGDK